LCEGNKSYELYLQYGSVGYETSKLLKQVGATVVEYLCMGRNIRVAVYYRQQSFTSQTTQE